MNKETGERVIHVLQHANGVQKGIKTILMERNEFHGTDNRIGLVLRCQLCKENVPRDSELRKDTRCCARYVLSQQPDFLEQKPWLEEVCSKHGHSVIFYPKYHCELNYIELLYGYT